MLLLAYLSLGAVAGFLSGLLGVGGGLVMVPGLYWLLGGQDWAMHVAVATSMAVIIPTGLMSARTHNRRGAVEWQLWRRWLPGVIGGVIVGTLLASHMPSDSLRIFFGCIMLLLSALLLWTPQEAVRRQIPDTYGVMVPLGIVIGVVSAMAGIGGATLSVPAMRWMNRPMPRAIGTASALGVAIAIPACCMYLWLKPGEATGVKWIIGSVDMRAALCLALASIPMAPVGARLTHQLPLRTLKIVFVSFMALVAIKLLSEGITG